MLSTPKALPHFIFFKAVLGLPTVKAPFTISRSFSTTGIILHFLWLMIFEKFLEMFCPKFQTFVSFLALSLALLVIFRPPIFIYSFLCLWWVLICGCLGNFINFILDILFCPDSYVAWRLPLPEVNFLILIVVDSYFFYYWHSVKSFSCLDNLLTFTGYSFLDLFL